jgi:type II secretory pathway component PulF
MPGSDTLGVCDTSLSHIPKIKLLVVKFSVTSFIPRFNLLLFSGICLAQAVVTAKPQKMSLVSNSDAQKCDKQL